MFLLLLLILGPAPSEVLLGFDTEMVDDPGRVEALLDILEKYDAQATFFVMGEYAQAHPEIVRKIAERNEVACHGMSHPRLPMIPETEMRAEVEECKRVVEEVIDKPVLGFRAPYHSTNMRLLEMVSEAGLYDASLMEYHIDPGFVEIPVTTIALLPAEDYIFTYLNPFKGWGWWLLGHLRGNRISIVLHPRFVEPEKLTGLIESYQGAKFLTHESLLSRRQTS